MFQTENGFHTDIDSDKAKIDINDCNFCHVLHRLILSGMTLVTQPMSQLRPNCMCLRSMDYYHQIFCTV